MIHKIAAGQPGTLTLSVTSNLILSLNSLWLPTTSNNIAPVVCSTRDVIMTTTTWQPVTQLSVNENFS